MKDYERELALARCDNVVFTRPFCKEKEEKKRRKVKKIHIKMYTKTAECKKKKGGDGMKLA